MSSNGYQECEAAACRVLTSARASSKNLISVHLLRGAAIYGVILAILLLSKIGDGGETKSGSLPDDWNYNQWYFAGYALFSSGMSDASLFVKILIVEILLALGIFGIIVGIIQCSAEFPSSRCERGRARGAA
ncbi:hypothetical protein JL720_15834 [Aureococcus anophagefferens]|nr:hypothetical protein JL720_15834 [Aureococcus anophagefferens]